MLAFLGVMVLLAGQPAAAVRSPYLDAVRQYGPNREREAVAALAALRLSDPDQAIDELDRRVCTALGARSCDARKLGAGPADVRARIHAAWQDLYPRALALHVEALALAEIGRDRAPADLHRGVLRRLIDRLDEIGRAPSPPAALAALAATGRHLLVWTLQLRADEIALAETLDAFDAERSRDLELRLSRADLDVLRSLPAPLEEAMRRRSLVTTTQVEVVMAQEEARLLERAARGYQAVLALDPDSLEARLRLARVETRLGRLDAAATRLRELSRPIPDPRQAYLAALFLADAEERLGRRAAAIAQYEAARRAWPAAQTPVLGLARLLTLDGASAEARAALATLAGPTPAAGPRSDPWHGYEDGQAWRLPGAMATLQASFASR